jgi:hypothetical protein
MSSLSSAKFLPPGSWLLDLMVDGIWDGTPEFVVECNLGIDPKARGITCQTRLISPMVNLLISSKPLRDSGVQDFEITGMLEAWDKMVEGPDLPVPIPLFNVRSCVSVDPPGVQSFGTPDVLGDGTNKKKGPKARTYLPAFQCYNIITHR